MSFLHLSQAVLEVRTRFGSEPMGSELYIHCSTSTDVRKLSPEVNIILGLLACANVAFQSSLSGSPHKQPTLRKVAFNAIETMSNLEQLEFDASS